MENSKKDVENILFKGKLVKKLNFNSNEFNNEAYLYRWLDNEYVVRKIGKQYNLTTRQLVNLEKNLHFYYNLLQKQVHVGLPKIFLTTIDKQKNTIFLVTEYFAKGNVLEANNVSRKIKHFKAIAMVITKIVCSNSNTHLNKLICSIDPNPNNFFIDSKNKLIYNDFTPPLYFKNNRWLEYRRRDELHIKKTEKVMRYFTGLNLLLSFVNKTRIYLPFYDYVKFVAWLSSEINKMQLPTMNNIAIFPEISKEALSGKRFDFQKFDKCVLKRDILRFLITFRVDLTNIQIGEIYKQSKKINGIDFLINKANEKN